MKDFFKKAGIRALRTFCQTIIATIGTSAIVLTDVNWTVVISASLLAAFLSFCTSVVLGLPEVDDQEGGGLNG